MIELRAKTAGFTRLFRLQVARVSDIKEPLRETGGEIRTESKETFGQHTSRAGKPWEPPSTSTEKRLGQTTAGPVTVRGQVRQKYIAQVTNYLRRQQKTGKYNALVGQEFYRLTHGGSVDDAIHESVRGSFARLRRELRKSAEQRRAGKREVGKHRLLGRIYSMVRLKVSQTGLRVGILDAASGRGQKRTDWNVVTALHNEGGSAGHRAKIPPRTFIELLAEDVVRLCERLSRWIVGEDS